VEIWASPPGHPTGRCETLIPPHNYGVPFDFVSQCPVNLPGCCFCSFSKLGSRMIVGRRTLAYGKRVQIPRCRATVSEEIATGHWGYLKRQPGKAGCSIRMLGQSSFERKLAS
jgi:hypothetical protein